MRCSILCRGTCITKIPDSIQDCVAYDISFHLNKTLITTFLDFRCGILNCLFEAIAFECTLSEKNIGVYSNETSSQKED